MVAKGEHDLMANRSDRRLPTPTFVRAHYEAARMIGETGARISIRATGQFDARSQGRIYDRNRFPRHSHPCTRAGSIYDKKTASSLLDFHHREARMRRRQRGGERLALQIAVEKCTAVIDDFRLKFRIEIRPCE